MAELIFNEGWRASAAKSDIDYVTAWNASTGTVYNNPFGLFIEQQITFPAGSYKRTNIYRAFLYWDTSALPDDAVIVGMGSYIFIEMCPQEVVSEHRMAIRNERTETPEEYIDVEFSE